MEKEETNYSEEACYSIVQKLMDNVPMGSLRVKYDGKNLEVVRSNKGFYKILGCTREELKEKYNSCYNATIPPESWERLRVKFDEALKTQACFEIEYCVNDLQNEKRWCYVTVAPMPFVGIGWFQMAISDITSAKETEQQLDSLIKNFPGCIICVLYSKNHATLKYVSEGVKQLTGYTQEEYREYFEKNADKIFAEDDGIERRAFLDAAMNDGKGIRKEYCISKKDVEPYWMEVRSSVVSRTGNDIMVQYVMLDITEQKLAQELAEKERIAREEKLRFQTEHDSLTGLYNSQTVRSRIEEKLKEKNHENAYVVVADIDEFKQLNDDMGHLFGDSVLCNFADSLVDIFPSAIIGRIGGDNFMIYLEGLSEAEIIKGIERLNKRLARIHLEDNNKLFMSASFGMARCEKGKQLTLDQMEKQADIALYLLKKQSAYGAVQVYTEQMAEVSVDNVNKQSVEDAPEAIIQTEGDLLLLAHELFDNVKDIRGVVRIISDNITRFYKFQDILYIMRESDSSMKLVYHWGENNIRQFYDEPVSIVMEPDWMKLLYSDESKESVVLLEEDINGENVNQAKSMLSFRVKDEKNDGYFVCVDRKKKRSWKEELPALLRMGEYMFRRYFRLKAKLQEEEEAWFKAKYDWVTGLPNYSYFLSLCNEYVKEHENQRFAIIYTDFLNFQFMNEVYGYAEGDKMLQEFAKVISSSGGIYHGRINADRFVSLCELHDMDQLIEEFLCTGNAFCKMINDRYMQCNIAIVGGITEFDRSLDSIAMNVDNANVARKNAKQELNVQALVYSPSLREDLQKQMEIEANMDSALKNGEFKVFLQPKIDMFTDKVIGAEALVRWLKPDGKIVSPGEFIPIFEKNGFVTQIDFEMLRQVLAVQQQRLKDGKPIVKVSVNFSRRHQESPNFIRRLDDLLSQYEVPTKSLEIEITESVFMRDLDPLTESIRQLKERGLSISIDDFGAGYSSLNVLSRIKADIVKLDRQFLLNVEMEKDNFTSEFLHLLVNMINQLGFKVLAEGVETKEQVELLKGAGCRFAQGFYYAKPMPVSNFLDFLDNHAIETEE